MSIEEKNFDTQINSEIIFYIIYVGTRHAVSLHIKVITMSFLK